MVSRQLNLQACWRQGNEHFGIWICNRSLLARTKASSFGVLTVMLGIKSEKSSYGRNIQKDQDMYFIWIIISSFNILQFRSTWNVFVLFSYFLWRIFQIQNSLNTKKCIINSPTQVFKRMFYGISFPLWYVFSKQSAESRQVFFPMFGSDCHWYNPHYLLACL